MAKKLRIKKIGNKEGKRFADLFLPACTDNSGKKSVKIGRKSYNAKNHNELYRFCEVIFAFF